MIDRRSVILGAIFAAGAGARAVVSLDRKAPQRPQVALAQGLPNRVAGRTIAPDEAPLLPQRDAITDRIYDDFVARSYRAPDSAALTLLIAYGGNQRDGLEIHRPENCYPPYGFALSPTQTLPLTMPGGRTITANTLTATRNGVSDQLLFWTRIGQDFPTSMWQANMSIARAALRGESADGVLVRLSVPTVSPDQSTQLLAQFAQALVGAAPAAIRKMLIGQS